MSKDASAQALRALSQFVVSKSSMGETLLRVSEITTDALPAANMAGISLLGEHGRPTTGVFTDPEAPEIDAAQYESGRGPCLDSWRTRTVIRLTDMGSAASSYPEFAAAALAHGVGSSLSLPLMAGDEAIGALNLYARAPNDFTDEDESAGTLLAGAAAIVLANASAYWQATQLGEQLSQAMQSRAIIEQAKGILMARSPQLSADEAFDLLRKASQRENVKLRDIAQRIVNRRGEPAARQLG
ncbi:MAG TPA: GAF and ANTAR domain-containing protein [Acidimicrobiales bacterium]|nr:GAF and ANTAR domain-containing protein [Acidimicrobiales bacterium]